MSVTILETRIEESADGRWLLAVEARRQSDDPAQEPVIVTTFHYFRLDDYFQDPEVCFLVPLATVRKDTGEPVQLDSEEATQVQKAAGQVASADEPNW